MSKVLVTEQHLMDIGAAIRERNHGDATYTPGEMAAAIRSLAPVTAPLQATENGVYTPPEGTDGFGTVTVNVPQTGGGGGGGDGSFYYDNDSGAVGIGYDADTGTAKFYFNGLEKGSGDIPMSDMLKLGAIGRFTVKGLYLTKAYGSDKTTQIGWIGFYNESIRTWNMDTSETLAGTFWGVLNLSDDTQRQDNPYEQPPV